MKKLCKECQWYVNLPPWELCSRPEILSDVNGKPHRSCKVERMHDFFGKNCGPDGKLWEQKEPDVIEQTWWDNLLNNLRNIFYK